MRYKFFAFASCFGRLKIGKYDGNDPVACRQLYKSVFNGVNEAIRYEYKMFLV